MEKTNAPLDPLESPPRILIVDDNRLIHQDFLKILTSDNTPQAALDLETALFGEIEEERKAIFVVDSAYQGQEAVEKIRQAKAENYPYAMAFVDVRMPPGWDGVETTQRIWEIDPDVQIVICTAYADYSWNDMFEKIGSDDKMLILKKPFDIVEVLQLTHALTEKWRLGHLARQKLETLEVMVQDRTRSLEQANLELRESISYAERIQTSILSRQQETGIPGLDYFCLLRPRDKVSGDFFWIIQHAGLIFIAVVDCTGHGVPGAFMSLIAQNILNEVIIDLGIVAPELILQKMHERVKTTLNQGEQCEGMDVCLCVIHPQENKLHFSGAKRPLYRTTQTETEPKVYKGDRFSVGGMQREEGRIYTAQVIDLRPDQTYYLTTDGFTDQNSVQNKKFGTSLLKNLLHTIQPLTLAEKKVKIEHALNQHQGQQPQRDDITLLAFVWDKP